MAIKIFFDTETTGLNYMKHSMHEIGGIIEVNGFVVEEFVFKVRPHIKSQYDDEALAVCKVTREELELYPSMEKIFNKINDLLDKYIDKYDPKNKAFLVGFNNLVFDDQFFRTFFELCGSRFFGSYFYIGSLDVMPLAAEYLKDRRSEMPSFKLKRVALELGIEVDKDQLHGSLYDAGLTRKIYRIVTGLDLEPNDELY